MKAKLVSEKEYELVRLISGLDIEAHITRVISTGKVRYHWHKELEFVQVVDGPVLLHTEAGSVTLEQDDIFIVNANELHCYQKVGVANDILILQVPLKHFQAYYPKISTFRFTGRHIKKEDRAVYRKMAGYIAGLFKSLAKKEEGYQLEVMGVTNLLAAHVVRNVPHEVVSEERMMTNSRNLKRLNRIISKVQDRYAYGISLEELAESEGLNKYYLSHFIKKYLGLSFRQYVRRLRLEKATDLLIHTDRNKLDICVESGFSDYRYLCEAFHKEYGCTPTEFRDKHRALKHKAERASVTFGDQYILMSEGDSYRIYFDYLERAQKDSIL
ncbi:MAG TPA: hypothetical protein DEB31_06520 [Clostridiales bacterium]|nr:hypothetical protein [Clostridiales bacterium]